MMNRELLKLIKKGIAVHKFYEYLYTTLILTCILQCEVKCQIDSLYLDGLYDSFLEEYTIDGDESDLLNSIEYYKANPLDVNSVTLEQLLKLPFIDYRTAEAIISYRTRYGQFFSFKELNSIDNIKKDVIHRIQPFLAIKNSKRIFSNLSMLQKSADQTILNLNLRSRLISYYGNTNGGNYAGSMIKQYNRLLLKFNTLQLGVISEKDAGERNFLDFSSFNITVKNDDNSRTLIAGDYLAEFGQGIVLGGNYGGIKTTDINSVVICDRNITPYMSINENKSLRGMAFNLRMGNFNTSSFISYRSFDAVMNDSSEIISSIPSDGNHRTQGELKNKDKGKEFCYGGRLDLLKDSLFSIGILYFHSLFDPPLKLKYMTNEVIKTDIYSMAYKIFLKNVILSGEIAERKDIISAKTSLNFLMSDKLQFLVLYRSLNSSILSLHTASMETSSYRQGIYSGIYSGFKLSTIIGNFSIYFDQYKFSPVSILNQPLKNSSELMIHYSKELNKKFEISFKYKLQKDDIVSDSYSSSGTTVLSTSRIDFAYNFNNDLKFSNRFTYCNLRNNITGGRENSFSFYQDVRMRVSEIFYFNSRLTIYNASIIRIYEFEKDLPGTVSNSILLGKGIKLYLLLQYNPISRLCLSLKYLQDDRTSDGEIITESEESLLMEKSKISLQIDFRI